MNRHVFLDHPGPIPFAHRGGGLEFPENSMEAFDAAVGLGYRYLETDVHVTADGVLVAFHDDRLDRVTDRSGQIAELSWDEVSRARIGSVGRIPAFEELLTRWEGVRINVDPKTDRAVDPLIDAIRRNGALEQVCVGSFSDSRTAKISAAFGSQICTSMGPRAIAKLRLASLRAPIGAIAGHCAQVPSTYRGVPMVTNAFVAEAHRRDVEVHVWTVDDPVEMNRLLDLGVDGIMTDRPSLLREVLVDRGSWFGG